MLCNLALESSWTLIASERFEAGVFTTMSDEVRRLTKSLATLTTNVRLFTFNECIHALLSHTLILLYCHVGSVALFLFLVNFVPVLGTIASSIMNRFGPCFRNLLQDKMYFVTH